MTRHYEGTFLSLIIELINERTEVIKLMTRSTITMH